MDAKVEAMIKLIEVDGDSFASRAEMYYKSRPELMKLVKELYRDYRAMAERLDRATGVIRHARRTMPEAFPSQVRTMLRDDSPSGADSRDMPNSIGELTDESVTMTRRKTSKQFDDSFGPADEEGKCLHGEIENGVSKLKGAEEQCLLHSEMESLVLKMGTHTQELAEKQKELGRLSACMQEERLRFVKAETAFQKLQHLHAKTQEELRAMASELQNRAQLLKVAEALNQSLQDEVVKVKEENKHLDGLNSSSSLSMKDMQNEISSLRESKGKLEEEVELRLDQRNALQQEINDLNKKQLSILDQVQAVGLNPESLGSSVKELQDENSSLKETCHRESSEKVALLQKLEVLDQLLEKNSLLEASPSDLNAELVRRKSEELEQSCQSLLEKSTLLDKKATLLTQLQETNKNLEKLSENNTFLETSLPNAHHPLEALKAKSKTLEDSCQLLVNEKADLITEKDGLTSQLEKTQIRLEDLEKLYGEMEGRCKHLENAKESSLLKVEELETSLELEEASIFGQLQYSMISQLLYEQKFHELHSTCLGYIDQNEGLKTQLAAFGPEIVSLKECISSLENQTDIHIKFQNPENEELQGAQSIRDPHERILNEDKRAFGMVSELHDLRVRLQAIVKTAVEMKEPMVRENIDLHSKLDASTRQIELLQSESGQYRRNRRPTSEITEDDNSLLTKDQVSDGSSYGYSKRQTAGMKNQIVESGDQDGTVGLTIGKSKKTASSFAIENTDYHRSKSTTKQKGECSNSVSLIEDLSVGKLEISKGSSESFQEGNKRKVLERLDSDVQILVNLQITVQDLKRKLEVTEKSKRGKAGIECEALKRQLEEADMAVMELIDLNGRLVKSLDDRSFSDTKALFDLEGQENTSVSEQARRMAEKIGRLQLQIQQLEFVLLKMDDEKEGGSKRRVRLRDYLYGGGRTGQRRKKTSFCACLHF